MPTATAENARALKISGWLTGIYFFIELGIGLWTGSVAVTSDAFHTFSAVGGVLIALVAGYYAVRPATQQATFGLIRAEIVGALFNGLFLLIMALFILWMGFQRLQNPIDVPTGPMLLAAVGGLITEVISLKLLYGKQKGNLNMQGAFWHVMQTFVGSLLIIVVLAMGQVIDCGKWKQRRSVPFGFGLSAAIDLSFRVDMLREQMHQLHPMSPDRAQAGCDALATGVEVQRIDGAPKRRLQHQIRLVEARIGVAEVADLHRPHQRLVTVSYVGGHQFLPWIYGKDNRVAEGTRHVDGGDVGVGAVRKHPALTHQRREHPGERGAGIDRLGGVAGAQHVSVAASQVCRRDGHGNARLFQVAARRQRLEEGLAGIQGVNTQPPS